ncbi:hypothetical protein [Cyclobacterium jeungdonense]|uniref:Uncharacterized protein n=1 Tax=Cyclobacterium jeungdonense TaxID=708087 RepID=A0ABT8C9M7_9BACT|nr:hypothetical protein [Cyclobacterium jeungdonense]MDN3689498.1 hypothetical protein [Cyclobacterium jeungdonense]
MRFNRASSSIDRTSTDGKSGQAGTKPGVREDRGGKDFCALIFWYFWIKPKVRKKLAVKRENHDCPSMSFDKSKAVGPGRGVVVGKLAAKEVLASAVLVKG